MRPSFHPVVVNDPFGDPVVYVDWLFERRALLLDLGRVDTLGARKLGRVTHAFVSHAHMDHFAGFDHVLRLSLHRREPLRLYGPPGFAERVEHKLAAYTWNLAPRYQADFTVLVTETNADGGTCGARFRCRTGFRREAVDPPPAPARVLADAETFQVRAALVDHMTPCLAFALEERAHVNVWRTRLAELDLPTGPWLRELKRLVVSGARDEVTLRVPSPEAGAVRERDVPLAALRKAVSVTRGQKIGYVVDVRYSEDNVQRIVELVRDADLLFIEAPFLDADAAMAAHKAHLTARQAGLIARAAGVRRLYPLHFSPRYAGAGDRLAREAQEAFVGATAPQVGREPPGFGPDHVS